MIDPADIDISNFLTKWYGVPDSKEQERSHCAWLPDPLRSWYDLIGRWTKFLSAGVRIYDPQQIRVDKGKAVFMADSTGDWFWAFDAKDLKTVYEAELRGEWRLIPESLPEFLVHLTLMVAADTANCARLCSQVSNETLPAVLVAMEEIGFGGWRWPRPGRRMFMSEKLIANVGPAMDFRAPWRNREGFSSVGISGINQQDLEYLDGITSIKWVIPDLGDCVS
ncbi:hypothetical protein [Streptomyces sp. NPDC048277]|uniref:hypothetical protein n=1 Tax=Streptomyces sp. NPDC048277 TaxID=3155027 RepID=UPI0033CD16B6